MQSQQKQLLELLEEARHCRTRVMGDCELEFEPNSPRWNLLRSRILRYFGARGLEGKILEIINGQTTASQEEASHE